MNPEFKKLSISLLVILTLLFLFDRAGGEVMRVVHSRSNDVSAPKLRYLADSCRSEILILGTSRANCHYVPDSIAKAAGMTVYNGGIDASDNIYSHYFMLCQVMRRHKPRMVILELMPADFTRQHDPFASLGFFAPYIGRSEAADSVFIEAGTHSLYHFSHLLRYNSKAVSNIGGLAFQPTRKDESGFLPLPPSTGKPLPLTEEPSDRNIDSLKLRYIDKFRSLCDASGIKLIFTISPCYSKADSSLYAPLRKYASSNGIPLLDFHTPGTCHDRPSLFRDRLHLNEEGARAYTSIFTKSLRSVMNSSRTDSCPSGSFSQATPSEPR